MDAVSAKPVVVGVDGSPVNRSAVLWAADEAARCNLPLVLVHAGFYLYEPVLSDATMTQALHEIDEHARTLLRQAVEAVRAACPDLPIQTRLDVTDPANLLVAMSKSATMVVLGTEVEGSISGFVRGSISQAVAAHAHCPVVVLNGYGPPNAERRNVVVVGVSPSRGGRQALRFAFEQARQRKCSVLAVRSWGDLGWGTYALTDTEVLRDVQRIESRVMTDCLAQVAGDFPEVAVERSFVGVRAQWALEEAAIGADLLVVGCHRADDHWFSRLGSVASWLLHRSPCPIAVVGRPQAAADLPGAEQDRPEVSAASSPR
ncbi:universal stress protein [Jatrophihabitans sp.]|uniref:universal stress protein n=1 Tax=Jatrophihabitans sp. TaxID=1932789 RepID=UPI002CCE38D4|nr:universal stress protein [Jatrophihabitans sp.]